MAARVKRKMKYDVYGNVAYAPGYGGAAAPALPGEEILAPRPKVRPRVEEYTRPQVRVREKEKVSLFAVVGFMAVLVFAILVVTSYMQLTIVNDQTVSLQNQLGDLKQQEAHLLSKYELAYDLKTIQEKMTSTGEMVKPQAGQMIVLDLSEPDSVVRFEQENPLKGVEGLISGCKDIVAAVMEYFG